MYNHQSTIPSRQTPEIIPAKVSAREHPGQLPAQLFPVIVKPPVLSRFVNEKKDLLRRMIAIVETHLGDETFTVGKFAAEAGLCRRQLHRKLRALTNLSPRHFITTLRLRRAAILIRHSSETIAEIAYQTGFNTPNYFCKVFREAFGCTPRAYREMKWVDG